MRCQARDGGPALANAGGADSSVIDASIEDAGSHCADAAVFTDYHLTAVRCDSCAVETATAPFVSDASVNCGAYQPGSAQSSAAPVISCVAEQLDAGRPFYAAAHPQGIDSLLTELFIRDDAGVYRLYVHDEGTAKCYGQAAWYTCSGLTFEDGGLDCLDALAGSSCAEHHSRVRFDGGYRPTSELRCPTLPYCRADSTQGGAPPRATDRLDCTEEHRGWLICWTTAACPPPTAGTVTQDDAG